MSGGSIAMAKPTDSTGTKIRRWLTPIASWNARSFGLLVSVVYIFLFINSRQNFSATPLTTNVLLVITLLSICLMAYVVAWRWPGVGGAMMLIAMFVQSINFIYTQSQYHPEVLDMLGNLILLCGPFGFVGLLFVAEGFLRVPEGEAAMHTPLANSKPLTLRETLERLALISIPIFILIIISGLWRDPNWRPFKQTDLFTNTIYAYRQWQSTDYYLNPGDRVIILANGQWMYSPQVGWHSPEGGEPAPSYYPMPSARGGALIGKIGEAGQPFVVGWYREMTVHEAGMLYLRINDDKLGDNEGALDLSIQVVTPTPTANP